ncbi:MAG: hypothetical protein PHS92_00340 [Candidatus Gracilibacteria bacterium]|nr:hypothetical protein [Candidatus Gracilibacteria bacterium]
MPINPDFTENSNTNEIIKNSVIIKKLESIGCQHLTEETKNEVFNLLKQNLTKPLGINAEYYFYWLIDQIYKSAFGNQIVRFDSISYNDKFGVFYGYGTLDPKDSWNHIGPAKFIFYDNKVEICIKRGTKDKDTGIIRLFEEIPELTLGKYGRPDGTIIVDGILHKLNHLSLVRFNEVSDSFLL